ncbi:MGMT family protein [Chloroflexota bacterium]
MFQPKDPDRFYPIVWQIVEQIPYGRVSSYGQIASMIPPPPDYDPLRYAHVRARWVGTAMRLSIGADIPWHRVINSRGMISGLPQPGARDEQRIRLEAEGIIFSEEPERVDFKIFGWSGPPDEWLEERGLLRPKILK